MEDTIITTIWEAGSRKQIFDRTITRLQHEIVLKNDEYQQHNAMYPMHHLTDYMHNAGRVYHQTHQQLTGELGALKIQRRVARDTRRDDLSKSMVAARQGGHHELLNVLAGMRGDLTPMPDENAVGFYHDDATRHGFSVSSEPTVTSAAPTASTPESSGFFDTFDIYGLTEHSPEPRTPHTQPTAAPPALNNIQWPRSVRRQLFPPNEVLKADRATEAARTLDAPIPIAPAVCGEQGMLASRLPNSQQDRNLGHRLTNAFDQLLNFDPGEANALLAFVQKIRIAMAYLLLLPLTGLDKMEAWRYVWCKTVIVWCAAVSISIEAWRFGWWRTVIVWFATVIENLGGIAVNDDEGE